MVTKEGIRKRKLHPRQALLQHPRRFLLPEEGIALRCRQEDAEDGGGMAHPGVLRRHDGAVPGGKPLVGRDLEEIDPAVIPEAEIHPAVVADAEHLIASPGQLYEARPLRARNVPGLAVIAGFLPPLYPFGLVGEELLRLVLHARIEDLDEGVHARGAAVAEDADLDVPAGDV